MEKTLTDFHHSLPLASACNAAGLPCVRICLSVSLKIREIREILKHTELDFRWKCTCESHYILGPEKHGFGKNTACLSDFTRKKNIAL